MIWRKNKKDEKQNLRRSEEVADIIDRMPTSFGRWVSYTVILMSFLFFFFGWIIKYPDVVSGKMNINSNVSPIKLVANSSGKLDLLNINARDLVHEGDYLAIIQNPAKTEDVKSIKMLLSDFSLILEQDLIHDKNKFPEKVSLGELNMKYYTFLSALKNSCSYLEENVFERQEISLSDDIKWKKIIMEQTGEVLKTTNDNLDITKKWFDKYASLNKEIVATYEYEVDRSKMEYLSAKQNEQSLKKETASIQMQIIESENRLIQLTIEKREKERQLQLDLLSSYHDLNDNIKLWEQKYVLKSPFEGKVEFLKFWVDNQFVQAGEDIFAIIPEQTTIIGQMILPASGSGKVKIGSRVSIKLDNYPYTEFGSVAGIVKSISLITQAYKSGENSIDTYLVLVEMPNGLTTNYGEKLDFKFEIGGVGDIIVKDRRLIERLFDNMKARTK